MHIFYFSNEKCSGGKGNYIYQLTKDPSSGGKWIDGVAFRGAAICALSTSNLLYAIAPIAQPEYSLIRVGYVSAADNSLGEAYYGHSGWISLRY